MENIEIIILAIMFVLTAVVLALTIEIANDIRPKKEKFKGVKYDTRPIIEQLDEAIGSKQHE